MSTHIARFAVAVVVIDQLNAILRPRHSAGIRKTLVDISFASRADESRWALAFEAPNFVDASSIIVARVLFAIVDVYLADLAESSKWAGA